MRVFVQGFEYPFLDITFAFAVFKMNVDVFRIGAAPLAVKIAEFLLCFRIMQAFGNADIDFGKTIVILERNLDYFGNDGAGLFGPAKR